MLQEIDLKYHSLNKTLELVSNRHWIENYIDTIESNLDPIYLCRLNNWCTFFNERFNRAMCIYTDTINALFDAALNNQLFRTQTTLEFQTSLKFYDQLFNMEYFMNRIDEECAIYLLNISLIVGKFPGMILKSTVESLKVLQNGISLDNLKKLFQFLFIKFENPQILSNHLPKLTLEEVEAIMHLNLGYNISRYEKLPLPMSKKESFIFLNNLPSNLEFENLVLQRAIICTKLIASNENKEDLYEFLNNSKTFKFRLDQFYDDIKFWKRAFEIICQSDYELNRLTVLEYIDYFEYKKYIENNNYSLKRRTINSVSTAIHNWHEAAIYQNKLELLNLSWIGTNTPELKVKYRNHTYSFKEITEGRELYMESQKMQHCAFSYIESCSRGYCTLWSLKKEINSIMHHYITLEVVGSEIVQVVGKRNRKVNPVEIRLIKQWAENKEYKFHKRFFDV